MSEAAQLEAGLAQSMGDTATGANGGLIPMILALLIGTVSTAAMLWRRYKAAMEDRRKLQEAEIKRKAMPQDNVFTIKTLEPFDGCGVLPIFIGVCGKVVDVSSSENIKYGDGYGKLWAGRDATYSLATLSLKVEDANKLDFQLSDFTPDQHKALAGWYKHFTTKYPVVGTLKEYENWDFSSIEEQAKAETPFGAKATDSAPAAETATETSATGNSAPAAPPDDAVMLSKGDKVQITAACEDHPDLVGKIGTLTNFDATSGRFSVNFGEEIGSQLLKPKEFRKVKKEEEGDEAPTRSF